MSVSWALELLAAGLAVLLALGVVWAVPHVPRLGFLDPSAGHGGRVGSLDGLRGFLAMGVVLSHAQSYRQFYRTGRWDWPPNPFFLFSGAGAVALFFAITGYLFWGQAIAGKVQARRLYARRFWRIYPLYAALVLVALVVCALRPGEWGGGLAKTLALLALPGGVTWTEVKGTQIGLMITQTWTLRYEVYFYLALPLLAPLARRPALSYGLVLLAFAARLITARTGAHGEHATFACYFAIGGLVAQLRASGHLAEAMRSPLAGAAAIVALVGLALRPDLLSGVLIPLVFVAFAPIAYGNDLFGLLTWKPCKMLGDVSYSLYMVHMVVLFLLLKAVDGLTPVAALSEAAYWGVTALAVALAVVASLLSYRLFERPFLAGRPVRTPRSAALESA